MFFRRFSFIIIFSCGISSTSSAIWALAPTSDLEERPPLLISIEPELVLKAMANGLEKDFEEMDYEALFGEGGFPSIEGLPIRDLDPEDLPYPNGANVGLCVNGTPGLEAAGFWAAKGRIEDVNFLFVLPLGGLYFGKDHPEMLFARYAAFFDKEGRLVLARFRDLVPLHTIDHAGLYRSRARERIAERGIPLLNTSEAIKFAQDKIEFGSFLREAGTRTPEFQVLEGAMNKAAVERAISDFFREHEGRAEIVLKPHDSFSSTGVKMFSQSEIDEAVEHAMKLLAQGKKVLLQERISNQFWIEAQTDRPFDWNLRVLTTWEGDRVVISEDMIEVRHQPYSNAPVSVSQGAEVMSLSEFFIKRGFSEGEKVRFLEGIRDVVEPETQRFAEGLRAQMGNAMSLYPYKMAGVLGWDLIQSDEGAWYFLEVNAGSVGGIETLERMAPDEKKGAAVIPIARHLARLAQDQRSSHRDVVTDEEGEDLDLLDDPSLLNNFACQLMEIKEFRIAGHLLQRALTFDPNFPIAWENLGTCLYSQRRFGEAERAWRRALEIAPERDFAWYKLGTVLLQRGRFEEAEYAFHWCLRINSEHEEAWLYLGDALIRQGKYQEAVEAYQRLIALDPEHEEAWHGLGDALNRQGKYQEAVEAYKRFTSLAPEDERGWFRLGIAYGALDEFKLAEEAFKGALRLNPNSEETWYALGELKMEVHDFQAAEAAFRKVTLLTPQNKFAWVGLGTAMFKQGMLTGEALRAYQDALDKGNLASATNILSRASSPQMRRVADESL